VDELDGDTCGDGRLSIRRGGEKCEGRPKPLSSGRQSIRANLRNEAGVMRNGIGKPRFHLDEVFVEPGRCTHDLQGAYGLTPVWSATVPPPRSSYWTLSKPARPISADRSSGPGKRRTLAGRYV